MKTVKPLSHICIVAAESSAWIAAAILAQGLNKLPIKLTIIELNNKPFEPSAESTLPSINACNQILQIAERDVMRECDASFKLATQYRAWAKGISEYFLPFSEHGFMLDSLDFQHYASRLQKNGDNTTYDAYALSAVAAKLNRFRHPSIEAKSLFRTLEYALHIDRVKYAELLKGYALKHGCEHITTNSISIEKHGEHINKITPEGASAITADLFIDASGEQALLANELEIDYIPLNEQLPNSRMLSVSCKSPDNLPPYTTMTSCETGWMQYIPLRSRTQVNLYYDKQLTDDQTAFKSLENAMAKADNSPLEPRSIEYVDLKPGKRKNFWVGNCISLGKAAGYIDEFTVGQLHLALAASLRILELLPRDSQITLNAKEFNRLTHAEYDRVIDFHSLHYKLANNIDSKYWQSCKNLSLSDSAKQKYDVFFARGKIAPFESETLSKANWISFFLGQNLWPMQHDPYVDGVELPWIKNQLGRMKAVFAEAANAMPPHRVYLDQYCPLD